jgi:hypothetical protein
MGQRVDELTGTLKHLLAVFGDRFRGYLRHVFQAGSLRRLRQRIKLDGFFDDVGRH